MAQATPMFLPGMDACVDCGKKSQVVMQWVNTGSNLIGVKGQVTQRVTLRFVLCLWCFRREEQELDPENTEHFRVVATIPGQKRMDLNWGDKLLGSAISGPSSPDPVKE